MTSIITLHADQELPAIPIAWSDGDEVLYDFASGWTATVKVCATATPYAAVLLKTAGITLAATSPNYLIEFSAADLATIVAALPPGSAGVGVYAYAYIRRNADSKDMVFRPGTPITLKILPAPA